MNRDVQALAQFFDESWQPMLAMMSRARAIEFRIRLAAEIQDQAGFTSARTWEEFQRGSRAVVRRKLERHIRTLFSGSAEEMILIRQCADNLAHADYRAARRRIDEYAKRHTLQTKLSAESVGIMLYKNMTHTDGWRGDMGYLLTSSDENLILEEYEVFDKQGYVAASAELLQFAEAELASVVPKMNLKYAALVISRGLKYGQKIDA